MQSKSDTVCIKCGARLPAGITFRQVKDDQGQVVGARCYTACRQQAEPEPETNPLCGHERRFEIRHPSGASGCVACVAVQAVELGRMQADEFDRFWAAMGVLSSEITIDQAVGKWRAMEAVVNAARKYLAEESNGRELMEALEAYSQQPQIEPAEEPA